MMMKAAPPFCPVINGKRQMFPKPIAEPAVARTMASLLLNAPLFSIFLKKLVINRLRACQDE
jgi:hypothetical protein